MNQVTRSQKLFGIFSRCTSLIAVFVILFPIIWLIRMSIMEPVLIYQNPPPLIFKPYLNAYFKAFNNQHLLERTFNSLFISFTTTFLSVFIGAMASYGITRFKMPFGKNLPFVFLFLRMIPSIAVLLPIFLMFSKFFLIDTFTGLIMIYTSGAIPTVIWMMWGYFKDLPKEIEESAYIDGCGYFNTFVRIILPITTPAIASVAILSFTGAWNEFMMATILTRTRTMTLPPAVSAWMMGGDLGWDVLSASGTVLMLPIIILCLVAQKYFVKGLTVGAVKG